MLFDKIVLINLDRRADRLAAFKAKIASIPELQSFTRCRAIHGDTVGVPGFFVSGGGAWGCRQSHLRTLEDAMLDGIHSLLVLEDDCCFCPEFSSKLVTMPKFWILSGFTCESSVTAKEKLPCIGRVNFEHSFN